MDGTRIRVRTATVTAALLLIAASARSIVVSFDFYFVRTGRAIVNMTSLGYDTKFSPVLAKSLLEKVVGRLGGAS
jgi:hypothetical protein